MNQLIFQLRKELDEVAMQLDNYYVQIKLHHERKEYDKAIVIFQIISPMHQRALKLQEKIDFYRKIEEMNQKGILAKAVKKVDETSIALGR